MILQGNKQDCYSPIAIDFGHSRVKMIQLHYSNEKPSLWQKAICPTPVGSIIEGCMVEPDLIASKLLKIRQAIPWKGKRVICSLPGQVTHTKIVTLPAMNTRQFNQAMRLQAEMLFPVSINAVEISYCALSFADQYHHKDRQNSLSGQYLLTAVMKDTFTIYKSIIEGAGFSLQSFDVTVGSLICSISKTGKFHSPANGDTSERILIDFGCKSTTVLLYDHSGLINFKTIAIGCNDFQQAILRKWPSLKGKAEQALFSAGSLSDKGLLPLTHKLTDAIRRMVNYRAIPVNSSTNAVSSNISVCGGGIYIPGLANHLQKELGMRLTVYNPLQYLDSEVDMQKSSQHNQASLFATAHGLAIGH